MSLLDQIRRRNSESSDFSQSEDFEENNPFASREHDRDELLRSVDEILGRANTDSSRSDIV